MNPTDPTRPRLTPSMPQEAPRLYPDPKAEEWEAQDLDATMLGYVVTVDTRFPGLETGTEVRVTGRLEAVLHAQEDMVRGDLSALTWVRIAGVLPADGHYRNSPVDRMFLLAPRSRVVVEGYQHPEPDLT